MSRLTEEEIMRVQHDLEGLDDEIRRLEAQAAYEQQLNNGFQRTSVDYRRVSRTYAQPAMSEEMMVPAPEFGGGGGPYYPYTPTNVYHPGYVQQPFISPLAGPYVLNQGSAFQQMPVGWPYATPGYSAGSNYYPSYIGMPQTYGGAQPYMQQPPSYIPQTTMQQQPPQQPPSTAVDNIQQAAVRERSGTQSMEELQAIAAKKGASLEKPDLGTALRSSVIFTLTMIGEATFFMIRDWLDTTKSRPHKPNALDAELEESVALAALEQLENSSKQSGGSALTEKQKMKHVKSMRLLMRATSVGDVVSGLRNSGRDEEAESLARRLLAIRKQMYGTEHIATAQALNQLGSVLVQQEAFEEAIETYEESIKVLRTAFLHKREVPALHESHLLHNLAVAKLLLAQSLESDNDEVGGKSAKKLRAEAIELGTRCVELCEKRLGAKHAKTIQYKRVWVPGFLETFKAELTPEQPEPQVRPVDLVLQAAVSIKTE